jgi:hypothetical protein
MKIMNIKEERGGRKMRGGRKSVEGGMQVRSKERELVRRRLITKDDGGVEEEMGRKGRSTQGRERKRRQKKLERHVKEEDVKEKERGRVVRYV